MTIIKVNIVLNNISEEDKQRQINNYFESHCKDLL